MLNMWLLVLALLRHGSAHSAIAGMSPCAAFEAALGEGEKIFSRRCVGAAAGTSTVPELQTCGASCPEDQHEEKGEDAAPACACARRARVCGVVASSNGGDDSCALVSELLTDDANTWRCVSDSECSAPRGACVSGRCECRERPRYGGARCEVDNALAVDAQAAEADFGEDKYFQYYNASDGNVSAAGRGVYGSGAGSSLDATAGIRAVLPRLVELGDVRSIADVPCGDFQWMQKVIDKTPAMRRVSYWGGDIVGPLANYLQEQYGRGKRVAFGRFDLSLQTLWPVDVVIVRDVLFHFPAARGLDVLRRIDASGARFLLTTFFPAENNSRAERHYMSGRGFDSFWRVNLLDAPFNLPPPLLNIGFDGAHGRESRTRVMGLWRLPLFARDGGVRV